MLLPALGHSGIQRHLHDNEAPPQIIFPSLDEGESTTGMHQALLRELSSPGGGVFSGLLVSGV